MRTDQTTVIIVGAGPSGLAVGSSLARLSIPFTILEREDCLASIWNKYSYDRLHFHLRKQLCELPNMPFPAHFPRYLPAKLFAQFLDRYAAHFGITPRYGRAVECASFDAASERWAVRARVVHNHNIDGGESSVEEYFGRFLVVATGDSESPFVPEIDGLAGFCGEVVHSTGFKSGKGFEGKRVLVVGAGNSGMEIALDLTEHGARTSIIIRSPIHVLSKGTMDMALVLLRYFPVGMVDFLLVIRSKMDYGDLTKYGITRPEEGPFCAKYKYGRNPIVDVGTCEKIKTGQIQVLPVEIKSINKNEVMLKNGMSYQFDSIIFCTGFKRSTHLWLKDDDYMLNDDGIAKQSYPDRNWKGRNGLYCVGLSRRGFYGAKSDAQNVANDINSVLCNTHNDEIRAS